MSEDCLFLNIIRPAGLGPNSKLPVLVWIHGGAWAEGSASGPRYNGSFLVQQSKEMDSQIIFASFNYRLGVFGLFPGSLAERDGITNVLLHDQRQALQYLQDNAAAFGGDPDKVTLMGESAGAGSIRPHPTQPITPHNRSAENDAFANNNTTTSFAPTVLTIL